MLVIFHVQAGRRKLKYGAWYLDTKLWKARPAKEPLRDTFALEEDMFFPEKPGPLVGWDNCNFPLLTLTEILEMQANCTQFTSLNPCLHTFTQILQLCAQCTLSQGRGEGLWCSAITRVVGMHWVPYQRACPFHVKCLFGTLETWVGWLLPFATRTPVEFNQVTIH